MVNCHAWRATDKINAAITNCPQPAQQAVHICHISSDLSHSTFVLAGKEVSPWHDIPLFADNGMVHYVCEIPKETSAKMECATVSPAL